MGKSKSGCREGSANRTIMTSGPARKLQSPIYGTLKTARKRALPIPASRWEPQT